MSPAAPPPARRSHPGPAACRADAPRCCSPHASSHDAARSSSLSPPIRRRSRSICPGESPRPRRSSRCLRHCAFNADLPSSVGSPARRSRSPCRNSLMMRLTRSAWEAPARRSRLLPAESSPSAIQTPTLRTGQSDVKERPPCIPSPIQVCGSDFRSARRQSPSGSPLAAPTRWSGSPAFVRGAVCVSTGVVHVSAPQARRAPRSGRLPLGRTQRRSHAWDECRVVSTQPQSHGRFRRHLTTRPRPPRLAPFPDLAVVKADDRFGRPAPVDHTIALDGDAVAPAARGDGTSAMPHEGNRRHPTGLHEASRARLSIRTTPTTHILRHVARRVRQGHRAESVVLVVLRGRVQPSHPTSRCTCMPKRR